MKKKNKDLRQEHQYAANAREHAVDEQILEQTGRQRMVHPLAGETHAGFDRIHRRLRPGEHGLEYQEQDDAENQRPGHRMQHYGIDPVARRDPVQPVAAHRAENAPYLVLIVRNVRRRRRSPHGGLARLRRRGQLVEHVDERDGAGCLDPDRFDHGHAKFRRQLARVDDDALAARDVRHIERNHHGQTQPLQTQHQPQVLTQVGSVGDADHEVR